MSMQTSEDAVARLHAATRVSPRLCRGMVGAAPLYAVVMAVIRAGAAGLFDEPAETVLRESVTGAITGLVLGPLSIWVWWWFGVRRAGRAHTAMRCVPVTELADTTIVVGVDGRQIVLPVHRAAPMPSVGQEVWVPDPLDVGRPVPLVFVTSDRPDGVAVMPAGPSYPHRYRRGGAHDRR